MTLTDPKLRHGRRETRMLWALFDPAWNAAAGHAGTHHLPWPHLQQLGRLERRRRTVRRGQLVKEEVEVSYLITSAPPTRADATTLLRSSRGHWGIENRLHWVRDVTFDEDRCQVRTPNVPQVLATLRNVVIGLLRHLGERTVADARRTCSADPTVALRLLSATADN